MKGKLSEDMVQALVDNYYSSRYGSLEAYVRQCLGKRQEDFPPEVLRRAGEILLKSRESFSEKMDDCCRQMLLLSRLAELLSEDHGLTEETREECLEYLFQEIQSLLPEVVCYLQQRKTE